MFAENPHQLRAAGSSRERAQQQDPSDHPEPAAGTRCVADVTRHRPWLCSSCRTSMSSQSDVLLFFIRCAFFCLNMEMCDKFTAVDGNATKNITAIQLNSGITVSRTLTLLEGTLEIAVAAFKIKLLST